MKKTLMVLIVAAIWLGSLSAAEMSQGWTYGFDLGLARGDNAGSRENFAPYGRGYLQLEIFDFLYMRTGLGFTPLHASKTYSTNTMIGDYRVIASPFYEKKVAPFIFAGAGASLDLGNKDADVIPQFPLGVGTKINYKKGKDIEITAGYNYTNASHLVGKNVNGKFDNIIAPEGRGGFFFLTGGMAFSDAGPKPVKQPTPPPPPPVIQKPVVQEKPVEKEKPVDLRTLDSDGDGLSDYDEINLYKTDPYKADTDGDGLNDYDEVMRYKTNPLKMDTDGDGLNDGDEVLKHKTDPLKVDTDGDGLNDGDEVLRHKTDPLKVDTDGDGLSDGDEVLKYKTNPLVVDTDKGGKNDGDEVAEGKNPLDPSDDIMDLSAGATFDLEGIMFETAKSTILPESVPILEQAYTALAANPHVKVLIVGHTDNVGSAASNLTLSKNRAASVKQWLVDRGIDASRMRTDGKGLTQPRDTNDTVAGRARNRRIEFIVE